MTEQPDMNSTGQNERPLSSNAILETLEQLLTITWDGNLASKEARDWLVKCGLAWKQDGYNGLTMAGVKYLINLGLLKSA